MTPRATQPPSIVWANPARGAPFRSRRALTAAAAAAAVVAGSLVATAAAQPAQAVGTTNPFDPSYQHGYRHGAVPTVAAKIRIDAFQAAHPAAAFSGSSENLRFGGGVNGVGVTTGSPRVFLVFWGSSWGSSSLNADGDLTFTNDSAGSAPRLQQLFKQLGSNGERWSGVMTQYCEGVSVGAQFCAPGGPHVGYPFTAPLAGVWFDDVSVPSTTTGHQVAVEAVTAASHFGNGTAAANRNAQYVIVSPHGFHPDGWSPAAGWCAWHDWNGDIRLPGGAAASAVGDIAFTNLPYLLDAGSNCGRNYVNAGGAGTLDGVTLVEGHEYAETITDQLPAGGWTDADDEENADKCAWVGTGGVGGAVNVVTANGSFAMQGSWSNNANGGAGGCENDSGQVTVGYPGDQAANVGTAFGLRLSAIGGIAPYTWTATGLPPGLNLLSLSGIIGGTPTTTGAYQVTFTAIDRAGHTSTTVFNLSVGRPLAIVPDVRGETVAIAANLLHNAGFVVGVQHSVIDKICNYIGQVMLQAPGPGVLAALGTPVALWIGRRPPNPCP
jgi:hypothetical protein